MGSNGCRKIARVAILSLTLPCWAQEFHPDIPKAWGDKAVEGLEVPLAQRDRSPRHMSAEEYYKLKVRPIYRSYPVYVQGREPAGYLESLKQKDPEIVFDPSKLHTREDWIAAGKLVFESDTSFFPAQRALTADDIPYPAATISKDGMLPGWGFRYYIRNKGVLERGVNSCSGCHTRQMADGSFQEGAQGIQFAPRSAILTAGQRTPEQLRRGVDNWWIWFGAPWVMSREEFGAHPEELAREVLANCCGVLFRQGTSLSHSVHIPSLIGLQDRKYLDATGLVRNRSIGDLMRYAILNEGLDTLAYYGDFQPSPHATAFSAQEGTRYSDEQLYALALYIYSLKPPPNPNKFDEHARKGQAVFHQQGCANCHLRFTRTTSLRRPLDSKFLTISARLTTLWTSASELTHILRSKREEARVLQSAIFAGRLVSRRIRPRRSRRHAGGMVRPCAIEIRLCAKGLSP